jgi:hyperosmotically inducible protein
MPRVPPLPGGTAAGAAGGSEPEARESAVVNSAWITTKIQAQYFTDASVRPWNIDVTTTNDGVVHLLGTVATEDARQRAVEIARSTDGVRNVEDQLRVSTGTAAGGGQTAGGDTDADRGNDETPSEDATPAGTSAEPLADAWITTKVNSKYFLDPDVSGLAVNVDTRNGVVTLRGDVDSDAARRRAIALARNTDGVRQVVDQLRVSADRTGADAGRGDAALAAASVEDGWITTKIQAKYFLDPDVKGRAIDVTTKDGVVTLAGTLASDEAKKDAELAAAQTEGVRRVVSRLTVAPPDAGR